MTIRTVLVPIWSETAHAALETAFRVGSEFSAHVEALHVRPDPATAIPLLGEGVSGVMIDEMVDMAEREGRELAQRARRLFDEHVARHDAPAAGHPGANQGFCCVYREEVGREDDVVSRRGRLFDLIVYARPVPDQELPSPITLNAALMETGRPLLVAPPVLRPSQGRIVAIAWNGSPEAARAVSESLPFLHRAERIVVIAVEENGGNRPTASDLADYLAWHHVDVSVRTLPGDGDAGRRLLDEAATCGADMLVMGAYTHSRIRQLILGGVTRHVLGHAEIPVLMVH